MRKQRQYRGGYEFTGLRELVQQQTTAEALLWKFLRNRRLHGFKFRRQHQIGRYVADFYCREAQLVVECDGALHDQNEQWQHDHDRDVYLTRQGVRVLRFTNDRILNETKTILREIANLLPLPVGEGPR